MATAADPTVFNTMFSEVKNKDRIVLKFSEHVFEKHTVTDHEGQIVRRNNVNQNFDPVTFLAPGQQKTLFAFTSLEWMNRLVRMLLDHYDAYPSSETSSWMICDGAFPFPVGTIFTKARHIAMRVSFDKAGAMATENFFPIRTCQAWGLRVIFKKWFRVDGKPQILIQTVYGLEPHQPRQSPAARAMQLNAFRIGWDQKTIPKSKGEAEIFRWHPFHRDEIYLILDRWPRPAIVAPPVPKPVADASTDLLAAISDASDALKDLMISKKKK